MVIPEARLKFFRRARALTALCADDASAPRRLALAVLWLWQEASFPFLTQLTRRPYGTSQFLADPAVIGFSCWLAEHENFNVAAYWLATAYAIWVGEAERTSNSLYFTPPKLSERVIDDLVGEGASLADGNWHDPACGGAAFLVPVAQRVAKALRQRGDTARSVIKHIEKNVSGSDLDETLLELSRHFLRMALYDLVVSSKYLPDFELVHGDGLAATTSSRRPHVVICNPPYRKLKAKDVEGYVKDYGSVIEGQPNIYGLFIHRSIQMAKLGGLVGLLTPTSYLSGQYFSKLRVELLNRAGPIRIDMLSGRTSTFIDVEQETAITVLRTRVPMEVDRWCVNVSVRTKEDVFEDVGQCVLPTCGRPWPIPKRVDDVALLKAAESSVVRLSSYGYQAKVGHLVDYRDERKRYSKPPKTKHGHTVFPLVWATDITPKGVFTHGRRRRGDKHELYVATVAGEQSCVIRRPSLVMQRVTSTDQPRRLVCAAVPAEWAASHKGFVAENHVIVIEQVAGRVPAFDTQTLALVLSSATVDRLFRSISGVANVSVFELNQVPMPDAEAVLRELKLGGDLESAVLKGYGLLAPSARAA